MQADLDNTVLLDTGAAPVRVASNDPTVVAWIRDAYAARVLPAGDPTALAGTEMIVANFGAPAKNRRSRHRLLDHFGNLWFATFERDEAADALARAVTDRIDAATGGTWLRLPVLVPAGDHPSDRAVLLHPWLGQSLDRLLPLLRRAGVAVHPSPQVHLDARAGVIRLGPAPRWPGAVPGPAAAPTGRTGPTGPTTSIDVRALVGVWDGIGRPEVVQWFLHAATSWDQTALDAMATLTDRVPYARVDSSMGLRSTVEQLAALTLDP